MQLRLHSQPQSPSAVFASVESQSFLCTNMADDSNVERLENHNVLALEEEEKDDTLIVYDEGDVSDDIKGCQSSLIGKIIIEKVINLSWV